MLKSQLLLLLQQEIRRHDFSYFIDEPPSVARGGRGVCVPGCPSCRKQLQTMNQFMDHLANDVLPKVIESLKPWVQRYRARVFQKISEKRSATLFAQKGGHVADIQRISVQQAHAKTKANQALLVCAYEDEAKCRMLNLDGSISFASLQSRAASLLKTQEIIFY